MANIGIQRKSPASAMWWVGIIALLVVLFMLFGWGDGSTTVSAPFGASQVCENPITLAAAEREPVARQTHR
jgi:hypothetical protein